MGNKGERYSGGGKLMQVTHYKSPFRTITSSKSKGPNSKSSNPKSGSFKTPVRQDRVNNVKSFFKGAIAKTATRDPHDITYHKNTKIPLKKSDAAAKAASKTKSVSKNSGRSVSSADSRRSNTMSRANNGSNSSKSGSKVSSSKGGGRTSSGGSGGRGGSGGGGGGGLGGGNLRALASRMVQQDINEAVRGLQQEAKTRGKERDFAVAKTNALYDRSLGDLTHVFGEVNENTAKQNSLIDSKYNAGKDAVAALYSGLAGTLGATAAANRANATGEQARLGIQSAGMGSFDADAANQANVGATNGANAQANLTAQQAAAAQVGSMLASMGSSSLAAAVGRANVARADATADSENAFRGSLDDIYSQMRQEQLAKGGKVNDLWMQLDDRAFARKESNRNFALARQGQSFSQGMQNSNFNLSVSKFNSDNLWKSAALRQQERREAAVRRQQAAALRGSSGGRPNTSGGINMGV